jgi:carbon monoxide dehydrogenase subunit G
MELTNDFRVAVPPSTAWSVLTDVERIAPCMPGAQLQEVEGDEYRGVVKVKVGPITAQYKGTASFVELDEDNHRAVLKAQGRDTRGQGNASATITATLVPDGEGTHVTVQTDLTVTGKVAQFGRGVMADVSNKLLGQFVECLESTVLADDSTEEERQAVGVPEGSAEVSSPAATAPSGPAVRTIDSPEAKPVDLINTAGAPVVKRVAPILAIVAIGWLLRILIRRRRK